MKVNISSFENLSSILNSLKNNDNIEIINLESNMIPYLGYFIDRSKELGCNVKINKKLLLNLNIFEHFSDRVQIQ